MSCRTSTVINDEELISEVRNFPELWNSKLQIYKNTRNKDAAWIRISERMKYSIDDLKAKWKALRDKYVREKKALVFTQLSGSEVSTRDTWDLFELMDFLKDTIKPRKTISSMTYGKRSDEDIVSAANSKQAETMNELTIETNLGDFVIEPIPESDVEDTPNKQTSTIENPPKPSTSSSSSGFTPNRNQSPLSSDNATAGKTLNDSASCSNKKPRMSKKDPYEQTLLKIWKENSEIISKSENQESEELFLLSLKTDLKSLEPKYQRQAKQKILKVLDDLITEQEAEQKNRALNH